MAQNVNDSVCGIVIEPPSAPAQSAYQGQTYYFCSQECKQASNRDSQRYPSTVRQAEHRRYQWEGYAHTWLARRSRLALMDAEHPEA